MRRTTYLLAWLVVAACGGAPDGGSPAVESAPIATSEGGLSAFEREHGIGPITAPVELGPPNHELEERGEELFELKCMACHRTHERYIGPALGDVLERRTPAYVLNMMMNPTEMTQRHPDARALLAEYLAPMPDQDLSEADARAILKYLRQVGSEQPE